jgi:outer membrane receptor for ferrienterochelin and colicin
MRSRFRFTVIVLGILALAVPTFLLADGTLLGTIKGRILDESGAGVPGATVEIVSSDKGFRRSQTTDATGGFTFAALQPGPFALRASLSGFQTVEKTNNIVEANKTTEVDVTMRLATAAESVTVTGEVPLVDKTDTSARTTVSSTLTQKLAISRNYQTLISNAPGVTNNSGGNPNVHGALSGNNQYLFDGVDTTDVTTGTFGQNFTFEAIQEIVISTAGISAEFGRAQGAIVNVITKAGTNTFSGSAKVILSNDQWNEDNKGKSPGGVSFNRTKFDEVVDRYAFTLGGPIWKDHLWFFGAYEFATVPTPLSQTLVSDVHPNGTGEEYQSVQDQKLWDGKLTFQATPSHLFTAQANSDPVNGFVVNYWGTAAEREALTAQDQNACGDKAGDTSVCVWQGRWAGVFGQNLSMEALYAEQSGDIFVTPFEGNGSPIFSFSDNLYYNGATFDGFVKRPRKQANLSATLYTNLFGNTHTFKGGVDYQDLESVAFFTYPTNRQFYVTDFDPVTREMTLSPGDNRLDFIDPAQSISTGKIWGFYALDKFEVGKNLFFNIGARVDKQNADSDIGNTVIDTTTFSPRVTGVYDLFGNGKTLFSGAYGRYYQFLVQDIADSVYAGVAQQANYDLFTWDGSQFVLEQQVRVGGGITPVNNDLKPSYIDEFNVAVQQQLGNTMAVGIRGIYRQWKDLIDDRRILDAEGNKITEPFNFGNELRRYFKGIELTFEKRFSRNWQASMNYTLSRSEGNQFGNYTTQLFDYADQTCNVTGSPTVGRIPSSTATNINQYGYAAYDRTHIVQAFTAYTLPLKWVAITAAPTFVWQSGLPYQMQRNFSINGETKAYFYDKRGSHRLPNSYQVDFALEAVFKPWGPIEIGAKGEVFNVTNQQYQLTCTGACLNPTVNFGKPTSRTNMQAPRGYRVTALARF